MHMADLDRLVVASPGVWLHCGNEYKGVVVLARRIIASGTASCASVLQHECLGLQTWTKFASEMSLSMATDRSTVVVVVAVRLSVRFLYALELEP